MKELMLNLALWITSGLLAIAYLASGNRSLQGLTAAATAPMMRLPTG